MIVKLTSQQPEVNAVTPYVESTIDSKLIKDAIQGYTAAEYKLLKDYQEELTEIQLYIKANRKSKLLKEIISDFFRFDHEKKPNWINIMKRVDKDKWYTYTDFIARINPCVPIENYVLLSIECSDYYKMIPRKQSLFRSIIKDLETFTPELTIAQLNNLLQGKKQQSPILWVESQYSFDYFIKKFHRQPNYKRIIVNHFTFKHGPASVRQGGTRSKSLESRKDKWYTSVLDVIVKNINDL